MAIITLTEDFERGYIDPGGDLNFSDEVEPSNSIFFNTGAAEGSSPVFFCYGGRTGQGARGYTYRSYGQCHIGLVVSEELASPVTHSSMQDLYAFFTWRGVVGAMSYEDFVALIVSAYGSEATALQIENGLQRPGWRILEFEFWMRYASELVEAISGGSNVAAFYVYPPITLGLDVSLGPPGASGTSYMKLNDDVSFEPAYFPRELQPDEWYHYAWTSPQPYSDLGAATLTQGIEQITATHRTGDIIHVYEHMMYPAVGAGNGDDLLYPLVIDDVRYVIETYEVAPAITGGFDEARRIFN